MVAAMRAWRLLAAAAVVLAIAAGALALASPEAAAQGRTSHLAAWSDAPNRIIVHWGDTSDAESYARGFAKGEEYIVRWKRDGGTRWRSADSTNEVPDKYTRSAAVATAGGASVGDPDLIIRLPVSDRSPGNVRYDIELYRSDASGKHQCLSPGRVDPGQCELVGSTSVRTNTSKTVQGRSASALFRGFGWASPLFDVRAAPSAQALGGTMYGVSLSSDSTYTVDRASGSWTLLGNSRISHPAILAWDGDTMYGTSSTTRRVYTVNLTSGAWTLAGNPNTPMPTGMEWDGSTMYGTDTDTDNLYTVDRTSGRWTEVGPTGRILPTSLGWDGSTMYGVDAFRTSTYTVDRASGDWTLLGRTNVSRPADLAWDGSTMYGVSTSTNRMYTMNRTSGAWTGVGRTGVSGASGLAWVPDASFDASLSTLTLSAGTLTPSFAAATTTYTADVAPTVSSITVTPTATDAAATITVDGTATASGSPSASINLSGGDNAISVVVTAEDGTTTRTYTVTVTRATLSTDATLSALTLSAGTLTPAFASATTTYRAAVEDTVSSVTVTPTATGDAATITVDGTATASGRASAAISLSPGDNAIAVVVTAEDGTTTEAYMVTVTRDTPAVNPGRVPKPTITTSTRQMTVTWEEPARAGVSAITGYDVRFSRGITLDAVKWGTWPHAGTSTTTTITGLKDGEVYNVQVRALNAESKGAWSLVASTLIAGALGEGCQFTTPSLGVIPARVPHAGPYLFCVPGASTLTAEDPNSRVGLWSDIGNLQCTGPATLSFSPGCHQIGIKGCGTTLNYDATLTLTGAGITPRTCVQSHGAAPRGIVSTSKYYDNQPDWTPLASGLVLGLTRMTLVFDPPGDWHVWLPAAIAPWGQCTRNHKAMSSEESAKLVRWPTPVRSGDSILIEGCASTEPVQILAAPITGHGQAVGVGVGVAGVYVQAAPEPLIDRGWLTTQLQQTVGVILFAVPLVVVPTVWGITRNAIVAGIATIALLLVTSIVLQLPVWAYLSVLLAAAAAFFLGMLLKK